MQAVISWSTLLASVIHVFAYVSVEPRSFRGADTLSIRAPNREVLDRVRQFTYPPLERRESGVIQLGNFNLGISVASDLFSVSLSDGTTALSITCPGCFLTGIGSATTTGFQQNDTLLDNIVEATGELAKNPGQFIAEVLDMNVVVDLTNVSGHFQFDINFASASSISIPIFAPVTPLGGSIDGNEIGILFSVDLVFNVGSQVEFMTGFDISFPAGAQFTFNPLNGELIDMNVTGVQLSGIPLQYTSGGGTLTAALRVGMKAGLGVNLLGAGFDIEAGIFVDIPTYEAAITFNPNATCQLNFTESIYGDAAAFAQVAASVDYVHWSAAPKTAITFWSAQLPGACIASSTTFPMTTKSAVLQTVTSTARFNTTTTTIFKTVTQTPVATAHSNLTSIVITSPVSISVLATPITGSFMTVSSSLSVATSITTSQVIAPAGTLTSGNTAPTSSVVAVSVLSAKVKSTSIPGFVGAQNHTSTSISAARSQTTAVPSSSFSASLANASATSTSVLTTASLPAVQTGLAVEVKVSGWMLAFTALVFVLFF